MVKFKAIKADISTLEVEAIVNAANTSLLGGGGVDGAIHRRAGPELALACRMLNGCKPGEAKLTEGFKLAAKYIIHTVGPVWQGGEKGEIETLASCYKNAIQIGAKHKFRSIAFPAISTGIYKFPKELAAKIAVNSINEAALEAQLSAEITFSCFDQEMLELYELELKKTA